jgi:mRNA-degrading endonuclease RelE of RelBE toxin-antitoxin system
MRGELDGLDIKKMSTGERLYRLRVGKIRLIFRINSNNTVETVDIDYRGGIY